MNRHVIGLFYDPGRTRQAITALVDAGVRRGEISIMAPESATLHFESLDPADQPDGQTPHHVVGLGATLIGGCDRNCGVLAIGPLLVALASLGFGTSIGGVAGALVGIGLPEQEARFYEAQVIEGGAALVGVVTLRHDEARIASILHRNKAASLTRPA